MVTGDRSKGLNMPASKEIAKDIAFVGRWPVTNSPVCTFKFASVSSSKNRRFMSSPCK